MKKSLVIIFCLMIGLSVNAQTKKGNTVTILCSQGFQGPELWDKQVLPIDKKGYITLFDGKTLNGWRTYGKTRATEKWVVEDGCIEFDSSKEGEGGDLIFAHQFGPNFEFEIEWKISKGGNSGIFYLAKEEVNKEGQLEPIYISCPECQVLDDANHPDAKLGVDGNRKSTSLYDMIPAKPQNSKPYGEWNKVKIVVKDGTVTHFQNGVQVLQYTLWTPEWVELLQKSKFREEAWPSAFRLLKNCGGVDKKGFFGIQDHGNDVWFRNIRVKILD